MLNGIIATGFKPTFEIQQNQGYIYPKIQDGHQYLSEAILEILNLCITL